MINIKRVIQVTQGEAPYQVIVNTEGESSVTERSNSTYEIDLVYEQEDQIGLGDSVTVIDNLGCIRSIPLQITNICESFYVSEIQKVDETYSVISNEAVTVDWSIDDPTYYSLVDQGTSVSLTQIASGIQQTNLRAVITNQSGCTEERRFSLFPYRTLAQPTYYTLRLNPESGLYEGNNLALKGSTNQPNAVMDWSTTQIINNTSLSVTQRPGQAILDVTSTSPFEEKTIYFTVSNNRGLESNTSRVVFTTERETTLDGFTIPPRILTTPFDDDIITTTDEELGLNNITGINAGITTANSATYNGGLLVADITGLDSAVVGIFTEDGSTALSIIRDLSQYTLADIEQAVYCNDVSLDLSTQAGIDKANFIVSGNATLINDTVTIAEGEQAVIVNVSNTNNQSTDIRINACGKCTTDSNQTLCDSSITLFDYLNGDPATGGTWSTTSGSSVPTTFDGSVILANGVHNYIYNAPANVGEYICTVTTPYILNINKVTGANSSNNSCATPQPTSTINGDGTRSTIGTLSSDCTSLTTWSGQLGNQVAHNYDEWFSYEYNSTGGTTNITISVTPNGAGSTTFPKVQLWSDCSTLEPNVVYTENATTATATFSKPSGNYTGLIQVISDNVGKYAVVIQQEVI